jgi:energy-coupling factor transporter ATP-binding protein EcfA2
VTTFAGLAAVLRAAPPRLGSTRLVCVDGPAGSGKTTFAARLAGALGRDAVVVHLDDLYAGWTITGAVARLRAGVLRPVSEGCSGAFHGYEWDRRSFSSTVTAVPPAPVLVVDGCGSGARSLDPWRSLLAWVEAPQPLRIQRGLGRDGADLETAWLDWQATEAAEFAREDTRARADVRVDGAGPGADGEFVLSA